MNLDRLKALSGINEDGIDDEKMEDIADLLIQAFDGDHMYADIKKTKKYVEIDTGVSQHELHVFPEHLNKLYRHPSVASVTIYRDKARAYLQ